MKLPEVQHCDSMTSDTKQSRAELGQQAVATQSTCVLQALPFTSVSRSQRSIEPLMQQGTVLQLPGLVSKRGLQAGSQGLHEVNEVNLEYLPT